MMRDEEDVAEHVLMHMIDEGLDGIIVAENLSVDGTREAIYRANEYAEAKGVQFEVHFDDEPGYYQSAKMTHLADIAHERGAHWIVPFDADEIWFAHRDRLGVILRDMDKQTNIVQAPLLNHFETILDENDPLAFRRMVWRQAHPAPLFKVAFRWKKGCVVEQGNHSVTLEKPKIGANHSIEIRHFPYRGFEHFKRKARNGAAAYAATDLPVDMGAHWRSYGRILEESGEEALREVYNTYFRFTVPSEMGMTHDPAPFRRW